MAMSHNYGFPCILKPWCNSHLKVDVLSAMSANKFDKVMVEKACGIHGWATNAAQWCRQLKIDPNKKTIHESPNATQYLGIAADEPERIERHKNKPGIKLPLVELGWDEAYCRKWCEENDLLSPIYTDAARGGCWFCHNQGVDQLRKLRHNYPDLWALLLKWDYDSPVSFKPDGHTVHDYDLRFQAEDEGKVPTDRKFRWKMLEELIE